MITCNDISVIIPVYNCSSYIAESIKSVKSQSLIGDAEIIVVDDGSIDNSYEIAKSLGARVFKQEHKFAAAARNFGIKQAKNNWIFFLDADDVLDKDAFKVFVSVVGKNNDVLAVFSKIQDFISPELPNEVKNKLDARKEPYSGPISGATFVSIEVFSKIGYFNENLSSAEGVDWLIRFRNSELKFINIDTVTMHRRIHMSNTGRVEKKQELKNIANVIRMMHKKQ